MPHFGGESPDGPITGGPCDAPASARGGCGARRAHLGQGRPVLGAAGRAMIRRVIVPTAITVAIGAGLEWFHAGTDDGLDPVCCHCHSGLRNRARRIRATKALVAKTVEIALLYEKALVPWPRRHPRLSRRQDRPCSVRYNVWTVTKDSSGDVGWSGSAAARPLRLNAGRSAWRCDPAGSPPAARPRGARRFEAREVVDFGPFGISGEGIVRSGASARSLERCALR